jgi:membrane protease YdiL (CAAX protease family)
VSAPAPRVDRAAVALFLGVAFGAAWLIASPLWLSGRGLQTAGTVVLLAVMMAAPTLGVLAVVLLLRRRKGVLLATGLRSPGGVRSWWRWGLLAYLGAPLLCLAATALAAAVGVLRVDLVGFSGFRAVLEASGAPAIPLPISTLVLLQLVQILVVGWLNVIPALAEEWGWRGWLLPALLPLGRWPAILAVGVIWGLWHAPVVLLGYDYPLEPAPLRLALMVVFCVVTGSLLGWLRLRSRSVWPCAIGHGFVNAAAGMPVLFAAAGAPVDTATTGLLGWTGWLLMLVALALVAALGRGGWSAGEREQPGGEQQEGEREQRDDDGVGARAAGEGRPRGGRAAAAEQVHGGHARMSRSVLGRLTGRDSNTHF